MSFQSDEVKARPGKVRYFGDYELLEEIARGVYQARQVSLNRMVALQLVSDGELATPADAQRFRAEVEAVANLDHPNIVPIYEVGEHDGQHYFSMKLIEGGSLAEKTAQLRNDPKAVAELIATIARAVHYAHQRGILHRSLKPANLLLPTAENAEEKSKDGPFLLFSVVSAAKNTAYMPPEQQDGQQAPTTAADVYALGAILSEGLTGQRSPPPRNPRLDRDLEAICLKCLEQEPEKRYASAAALADDLDRWRKGEPILARPMPRVEKVWRWTRRHPTRATSLYLAVNLLVLLIVTPFFLLNERAGKAEIDAEHRGETERSLARTERLLYDLRISAAAREWQDNHFDVARRQLDACPHALRGWEWSYLSDQLRTELLALPGSACVAFSPDGAQLAATDATGKLLIWDTLGAEVLQLAGHSAGVNGVAFAPDGRLLASAGRDSTVKLWDLTTRKELRSLPGHSAAVRCVAFSPDGVQLASCGGPAKGPGEVKVWDVATGKQLLNLPGHDDMVQHVAFSPDGARLVTAAAREVRVWDAATGTQLLELPGTRCALFSPDGERIAALTVRGVTLWDAATGKEVGVISAVRPGGFLNTLAFSPDGVFLATTNADQTITLWDAFSGEECFTLRSDNGEVTSLSFRPDGQRLAAAGRQVRVWDVTRRPECRSLPDCVNGLCFGGDGRLAAVGRDFLKVWEPDAGRLSQSFPLRDRSVRDVALSPEGRILAVAEEHDIALRDTTNGRDLRSLRGHDDTVLRIVFRPDGRQLASGSADRTVKLWADNGKLLHTLDRHEGSVSALAFRADGQRLATGSSDGQVKVWDTETGEELRSFAAGKAVSDVAFSPDGGRLAWVAGGVVKVLDLNSGTDISLPAADVGSVRGIAFHPDGERLATVGENRAVLWDTATGQPLLTLPGHFTDGVRVAFSPDGNRLAALSRNEITVWGKDDGERARALALRGDAEAGRDWHREQAEQLSRRRLWFAALVHLNRLLAERPRDSTLLALRGRAHAGRQDWEAAALDYRRAIEGGLTEPWVSIDEGLLRLRAGNRDGYRETCQALLRRSGDADTASTTCAVVEACVLLPNAVKDFAAVTAMLERALVRRPGFAPLLPLRGPALYRAGKHRDAAVLLEETVGGPERSGTVEEWLFLALARQQLGRKAEARQAFAQAVKESRRTEAATWQERLRRETLRQEAEGLLGKE